MSIQEDRDAFAELVQATLGHTLQPSRESTSRIVVPRRSRFVCGGLRALPPEVARLYADVARTCDQLTRRKIWKNRALIFRINADGEILTLCPLVEYRLPKDKAAQALMGVDASYFLTADQRLVKRLGNGDELVVPTQHYWANGEEDLDFLHELLGRVRDNYR